ncbi:MAG: hypothetical protein GY754_27765 [bacterium]|nr:hypothetical protein [bacterium]
MTENIQKKTGIVVELTYRVSHNVLRMAALEGQRHGGEGTGYGAKEYVDGSFNIYRAIYTGKNPERTSEASI